MQVKIAFFVGSFPMLSETFILNQVTGLIDRGHDVDIFANQIVSDGPAHADVAKYRLLDRSYLLGNSPAIMPENLFFRVLKAVSLLIGNFHKKPFVLLKSLNFLKYGREAVSLNLFYRTIGFIDKSDRYDIFQCHFGHYGNQAALMKSIGAIQGKVVTTFHGYDISRVIKLRGRREYNYLFKSGDVFLPISEKWKNELIDLGCDPRKIIVHRMGIDPNHFLPCHSKNTDEINIISIGRFVEKKGISYGVKAVVKVLEKYPQVRYQIVGDGPLRPELEGLISDFSAGDKISLLGWKRQDEIVELMKTADIFLAPSVTDSNGNKEGIPVVLMEAMAQQLPIVSTQHSGIPELVKDGISGFLVPEGDVDALYDRLIFLIEHPDTCNNFGRSGRMIVEDQHDINKLNDSLAVIFRQLLC